MVLIEEVYNMMSAGYGQEDIIAELSKKSYSPKEIAEAMAQAQIKEAVGGGEQAGIPPAPASGGQEQYGQAYNPQQTQEYQQQAPQPGYEYAPQAGTGGYSGQQQYDSYQGGGMSTDTMTEIAEQVMVEKLSPLRQRIEEILNMRTGVDAKIEYLDERLKRIEKVIDRLQLSVLQKVGTYVTNVEDMKKELEETQKTFKAMAEKHRK